LMGTYFPDGWVNRQDQAAVYWTTNPPAPLPSNVSLAYQVGVSVSSDPQSIPTLTNWITINNPPPVTVTGLGMANNNAYYFFVRTITPITGLTLPPSPVTVATLRIDTTKPATPSAFTNLPSNAPSGVFTLQWPAAADTGPSGLYAYKIREYVDGNPVPREIVQV